MALSLWTDWRPLSLVRVAPAEDAIVGPKPSRIGLAALAVALAERGHGELGGNNVGPDVDRYRRVASPSGRTDPWCAWFASWCLEEGCKRIGYPCPVERSGSARVLWLRCCEAGARVATPLPGDVGLVKRPGGHHIFFVWEAVPPALVYLTIEGNHAPTVTDFKRSLTAPELVGFARLAP
jgi:hypothetical protein